MGAILRFSPAPVFYQENGFHQVQLAGYWGGLPRHAKREKIGNNRSAQAAAPVTIRTVIAPRITWIKEFLLMAHASYAEIAGMIDHSLLQQTLTDAELDQGCQLARAYQVASVCIKPYYVGQAVDLLSGSSVVVGTTIGFPHGGHVTSIKVSEAVQAMKDGARELDMVVNIGKVLGNDWAYVAADIRAVVEAAHAQGVRVKVIFENCFLANEHKEKLCVICGEAMADWVKTSTGYGSTGATDEDLRLMRRCSPSHVQVKAAGGVRTYERILAVRALGVTRVGATATQAILDDCKKALQT